MVTRSTGDDGLETSTNVTALSFRAAMARILLVRFKPITPERSLNPPTPSRRTDLQAGAAVVVSTSVTALLSSDPIARRFEDQTTSERPTRLVKFPVPF